MLWSTNGTSNNHKTTAHSMATSTTSLALLVKRLLPLLVCMPVSLQNKKNKKIHLQTPLKLTYPHNISHLFVVMVLEREHAATHFWQTAARHSDSFLKAFQNSGGECVVLSCLYRNQNWANE